jgi:glycine oxidase
MEISDIDAQPLYGEVAVVGAGLLGRLLAWKLLLKGCHVTLFERGSRHAELSAARVAAAMLAPYSELVGAEREIFDWGRMALQWWPLQLALLREQTGMEIDCRVEGSLVVAHEQDRSSLRHFYQQLIGKLPDTAKPVEHCNSSRLRELEPELCQQFREGYFLPDEGYLDNTQLLRALEIAISHLGGTWREYVEVTGVSPHCVTVCDQVERFDLVLDCRGTGAKSTLPALRGVRGEVLWLHAPEVSLRRPVRLMHPRYKLYVVPRPGHRYVIGATEIESESMAPVTVRSHLELLSALYSLHRGFAEAEVEQACAHCRPALPDNMPVVRECPGLLVVNGLYRHGYLLSPHVVESALARVRGLVENVTALTPKEVGSDLYSCK